MTVTAFLDTDVLVECLRGSTPAATWLESSAREAFQVPGIVAMELLSGCRDQNDLRRCRTFLSSFDVVWPEAAEFAQACELLITHRLSSGVGIPDCLIAAMAISRSARLYTFNLRHFRAIPAVEAQEPYKR